jgi:hypothetical protein
MAFERSPRIEPGERPDLQDLCEYLQDLRPTDSEEVIFVLSGEAFLTEPNSRERRFGAADFGFSPRVLRIPFVWTATSVRLQ